MDPPFQPGTPRPQAESGEAPQPPVTYTQETMPPPIREYIDSLEAYREALSARLNSNLGWISQSESETSDREGSPSSTRMESGSGEESRSSSRAGSRGRTTSRAGSTSREGTPSNKENRDRLIAWVNMKFIPVDPPRFLESKPFALCDLKYALKYAVDNLNYSDDVELYDTAKQARGPGYCVEVNLERMYATRVVNWKRLDAAEIDQSNVATVKWFLYHLRKEREWIQNELNRIKMYMRNAVTSIVSGSRTSFGYTADKRAPMLEVAGPWPGELPHCALNIEP